jgi:hypothetical protein
LSDGDGEGNGAAPVTLAQQVAQLAIEVARVADETEGNKWRISRQSEMWGKHETQLNRIEGHSRDGQKAAADAAHHVADLDRRFEAFKVEAFKKLDQLAAGLQVLVDRKSVRRGRRNG